jgi:hypothetical protein
MDIADPYNSNSSPSSPASAAKQQSTYHSNSSGSGLRLSDIMSSVDVSQRKLPAPTRVAVHDLLNSNGHGPSAGFASGSSSAAASVSGDLELRL